MDIFKLPVGGIRKIIILLNFTIAFFYISWWFIPSNIGNPILYYPLFAGEIYHLFMAVGFWLTIWPFKEMKVNLTKNGIPNPAVDVYITVAGEPASVIRETAEAARSMVYPDFKVYFLNDGYVAKKDNWHDPERIAKQLQIGCITRKISGGAKAGNINNALKQTSGEIVVILDADMVPHQDFLQKVIPYFRNNNIGFVQTPQYYKNFSVNMVAGGSWEQQQLFFGPIMVGKGRVNSAFICGTNVAIRKKALIEAGGMAEDNIAEDFITSLAVHQKGWKSVYINEVLCEGLAPEDLLSYYKQQMRWSRGSLEVVFRHNPLFKPNLSWQQKIQYLSSALYYFNGIVVLIDIIMPLLYLFFRIQPVAASTTTFAIFFLPFMFLNLYSLFMSSDSTITLRALSFSQSSWTLQLRAFLSLLLNQKMKFAVTSKKALEGDFLFLAYPHIAYIALVFIGSVYAIYSQGLNPAVMTNIAWGVFNTTLFIPYIAASYRWSKIFKVYNNALSFRNV